MTEPQVPSDVPPPVHDQLLSWLKSQIEMLDLAKRHKNPVHQMRKDLDQILSAAPQALGQ